MLNSRKFLLLLIFIFFTAPVLSREKTSQLYHEGESLALKGDIDGAIEIFKKVVELSPYYCMGHYGLGKAYLYKYGMLDLAIQHLSEAVKLDRKLAKGHFYLGMAYFLGRKYIQALHSFKNAYDNDDSLIEALYNISVIYDIMGKKYEAEVYYKKYITEKERDEDILF